MALLYPVLIWLMFTVFISIMWQCSIIRSYNAGSEKWLLVLFLRSSAERTNSFIRRKVIHPHNKHVCFRQSLLRRFLILKTPFYLYISCMGGICMPQCTHEDQRITCVRWLSAATQWILRIELESKGLAVHNFIHGAISLAQFFTIIVFLFHFAFYFV